MRRVLIVHNGSAIGGAELSLCEFLRFLENTAACTPVVACRPGTEFWQRASTLSVKLEAANLFRMERARSSSAAANLMRAMLRANVSILRAIRRWRIELVHANNTASFLQSVLAARISGVPLIWHIRDRARIPARLRFLETWANGIIAISRAVALDALWKPQRADVIRNGLALASETGCGEDDGGDRSHDLLMVAQFVPWKRHSVFLEAVAELQRRGKVLNAAIAGVAHDADQRAYASSLRERAKELGISEHVEFLASDDDPRRLLRRARVLVHPAVGEPMGRVIGEAMCVGTRVVASRSGGIPELIEDGNTGLLVTPEDPRGFADAIEEALDPAIGAKLAKNARHAASKLFDLEKQCNKVLGAYSRALEPPMRRKVYACHVDR